MGKISKLLKRAEELAGKEMEKLAAQQQQQQQPAYSAPVIHQQQPGRFSTPPPAPRPYDSGLGASSAHRPSTPTNQGMHAAAAAAVQPPQHYLAPTTLSPSPSPAGRGRKKALLIACSYPGTRSALRGPGNDASCMEYLLKSKFGFQPSNIVVLRDDINRGPQFMPTRDTIFRACAWLMSDLQQGDSLFLHFSGHGSRLRDPTGMEDDGYDETILPTDFKGAGQIRDTELAQRLCHPLPRGVTLHALFDSCHSGTMLDLPHELQYNRQTGAPFWKRTNMRGTAGGTVVQFGASEDHTTAADTAHLSGTAYTGAATFTFIDAVEKYGTHQTYMMLLSHMVESLKRLGKTSVAPPSSGTAAAGAVMPLAMGLALGPMGLIAGGIMGSTMQRGKLEQQRPVMCCSHPIDVHRLTLTI